MPRPPARRSLSRSAAGAAVTRTLSSGARVSTIVYVATTKPAGAPVASNTRSGPPTCVMTMPASSLSATWTERSCTKIWFQSAGPLEM